MLSGSRLIRGMCWVILSGLPLTAFGPKPVRMAPVPADPFELVTGPVQLVSSSAGREDVFRLLSRARSSYVLRDSLDAWDLKVRFTVDSGGGTNYDGKWEMEDQFAPAQGDHWTATSDSGYAITGIFLGDALYSEGTARAIPLRLQEARAMLFNPLPSTAYADKGSIRTAAASFQGTPVTCVLLTRLTRLAIPANGRAWDESEDCIDLQTGLLKTHSEVPGRYSVYDYTNAPRLGEHVLPRTVTVTEAGRTVSKISVEDLRQIPMPDSSLFRLTDRMKASGEGVAMASASKLQRMHGEGRATSSSTIRPVCVFGLVSPGGKLVEAHSLQPADPNSAAALKDAKEIDFSPSLPAGGPPQQHFVFVIEKFLSPR